MTFFSLYRRFAIMAAATIGSMLIAISGAGAFTFEGQGDGNRNTQGFTDLQLPGASNSQSSLSDPDKNEIKSGNTTFQFGTRPSFDQRYNSNNLFDPFAREGR
jgi:hypothetical protein